ncbi:Restriction endonuclease type IV Mrr domain-containing protein [Pararobbsia alpina]|uniref:hypothetical protein n=1 Tax=Pararobbsia alpina TaxID=621374 RepID=UPI0039A56DF4
MTHNDSILESKLYEWIQKTGFPLEMDVASAFRKVEFDVRQAGIFVDRETNKGRELDVVASDPDSFGIIEVSFVIECKASSNPWVVLTSEDALARFNRIFAFGVLSKDAMAAVVSRQPGKSPWFAKHVSRSDRCGYGLRQAFAGNNDSAYSAAMSAIKGCHDLARRDLGDIPRLTFTFPVIVIDAPLYECSMDNNGELLLSAVDESEFLFSARIPDAVSTCVKIVQRGHLPAFASRMKTLARDTRIEFAKEEQDAFGRLI